MSDTPTSSTPPPATAPADKSAFWRQAVADHAASGRSVRDFCLARGLSEKRFFTWRRSLGLSPAARPTPEAAPIPRPAAAGFVPVRVVPDTTAEVTLPGGVTVRVPVHADAAAVARLVAALAGGGR